jgi:hypothetical protein
VYLIVFSTIIFRIIEQTIQRPTEPDIQSTSKNGESIARISINLNYFLHLKPYSI